MIYLFFIIFVRSVNILTCRFNFVPRFLRGTLLLLLFILPLFLFILPLLPVILRLFDLAVCSSAGPPVLLPPRVSG